MLRPGARWLALLTGFWLPMREEEMGLQAAESNKVRACMAKALGVDPARVVPEATILGDLGGTNEQLQPMQEAIERELGVSIKPIVLEVNARTSIGAEGLLTAGSLEQIGDYLGPGAVLAKTPVSFPAIFTVALIEAMAAKALTAQSPGADLGRELPAEAITLSPTYAERIRATVAELLEVPLEKVTPAARLMRDLGADELDLGFAIAAVEKELGISIKETWMGMVRLLEDLGSGLPTPATLAQLRIYFPDATFDGESTLDFEEMLTIGFLEQVVARTIATRESVATAESGAPRRRPDSHIVEAWTWPQQDWLWGLPERLGPRGVRLLLAGGVRHALAPDGKMEWEIVDALDVLERYADTEKNKSALEKMHRTVGTWKTWRYPAFAALHAALSGTDLEAALPRVTTAVAVAHKLDAPAALARMERLVAELSPARDPGRPFEAKWRTPEAVELAWSMCETRDFGRMPQLADLLERAGCNDAAVLEHARQAQGIHFRGCWVVDLVLDGLWRKPPKKKAPKTKTLLSTLSKQAQRDFKDSGGGSPIPETIPLILTQFDVSQIAGNRESYAKAHPGLTGEQVDQAILVHATVEYGRRLFDIELLRRILEERAEGLVPAQALAARSQWLHGLLVPDAEHAGDLIRQAFAVRDLAFIQEAAKRAPRRETMWLDEAYWPYVATLAVAERDRDQLRRVAELFPQRVATPRQAAMDEVFRGMAALDAAVVQAGLARRIEASREEKDPEAYGVIDIEAHGLYRMAEWWSPELVAGFDVALPHPWDAEFHRCVEEAGEPLAGIDLSSLAPIVQEALLGLKLPDWIEPSPYHLTVGATFLDVVLLSVGPNPKKVVSAIRQHTYASKEQVEKSIERSPMVVHSRFPKWTAENCCKDLLKAGAKAELRSMTGERAELTSPS